MARTARRDRHGVVLPAPAVAVAAAAAVLVGFWAGAVPRGLAVLAAAAGLVALYLVLVDLVRRQRSGEPRLPRPGRAAVVRRGRR